MVGQFSHPEYQFVPKKSVISGYAMSYLDEGKGFPVIMVHGNPTWSFFYRNLVTRLKKNFRCIAVDHIGCGLSEKPQQYNYTLSQHIENLETLLESLKIEKCSLVVHDWGGAIGFGYAVRHPEKIHKITVMNTAAFRSKRIPLRIAVCRTPVLGEYVMRQYNLFLRASQYMATSHKGGIPADIFDGYLHPYDSYENRIAIARFVADIPMSLKDTSYMTLKEIEGKLSLLRDKKMLLLWGCRDFCFHTGFLRKWQSLFPEAETIRYENAGHYVLEDEKKSIDEIEWFLQSNMEPNRSMHG